jgi:hypothetical protein
MIRAPGTMSNLQMINYCFGCLQVEANFDPIVPEVVPPVAEVVTEPVEPIEMTPCEKIEN